MERINIGTYAFGGFDSPMTLKEKLNAAKAMGYTGVELLAQELINNSEDELKAVFAETGLECVSVHAGVDQIDELLPKFAAAGGKMMIVPGYPFANREEAIELAEKLTAAAAKAAPKGVKIGYHNHTSEFYEDGGKPILEYVIENTEKGAVWFQLDCGWAAAAGVDPAAFINKFPGCFIAIHVKENNAVLGIDKPRSPKDPPPEWPKVVTDEMRKAWNDRLKVQCPLGDASSRIDWKAVKAATDAQGTGVAWTVEREYDYLGDMNKCLAEDVKWLRENI